MKHMLYDITSTKLEERITFLHNSKKAQMNPPKVYSQRQVPR
jgi:hypothetical protein